MGHPFKGMIAVLLLGAASAIADEIRIAGQRHRDVYVGQTKEFYYVHFPETGVLERHSRKRLDVTDVVIDEDDADREALLARYQAAKAGPATGHPGENEPRRAVADTSTYTLQQELLERAEFESRLVHWQALGASRRQEQLNNFLAWVKQRLGSRGAEMELKLGQLQTIAPEAFARASAKVRAQTQQAPRVKAGQQVEVSRNGGNLQATPLPRQVKSPSASATPTYGDALHHAREGLALRDKALDEFHRFLSYATTLDDLELALRNGYQYTLRPVAIGQWQGGGSQKTAPVVVPEGVWRLTCSRSDDMGPSKFSITIHDAQNGRPFTRIDGADFMQMRMRVYDDPGRYYLKIEQDESGIPYQIAIEQLVER